jgi:hypothetical protein
VNLIEQQISKAGFRDKVRPFDLRRDEIKTFWLELNRSREGQ